MKKTQNLSFFIKNLSFIDKNLLFFDNFDRF